MFDFVAWPDRLKKFRTSFHLSLRNTSKWWQVLISSWQASHLFSFIVFEFRVNERIERDADLSSVTINWKTSLQNYIWIMSGLQGFLLQSFHIKSALNAVSIFFSLLFNLLRVLNHDSVSSSLRHKSRKSQLKSGHFVTTKVFFETPHMFSILTRSVLVIFN